MTTEQTQSLMVGDLVACDSAHVLSAACWFALATLLDHEYELDADAGRVVAHRLRSAMGLRLRSDEVAAFAAWRLR